MKATNIIQLKKNLTILHMIQLHIKIKFKFEIDF